MLFLGSVASERKNKWRSPAKYEVGGWVLIHKSRWPQRKVEKIASPWFGPFKVVQLNFNSLSVLASPSLGGLVKVSFSQVKHWSSVHDPHGYDGSPDAGGDEESEGGPVSAQFAESPLVPSRTEEAEREAKKNESAGDAPEQEGEHERRAAEQPPRRATSPRRTRRTTREQQSARDQAQAQRPAAPASGVSTGILPSSRTPTSSRTVLPVGFGQVEQEVQVEVFPGLQAGQEVQGHEQDSQDVQIVQGEREPQVVLPAAGKKLEYTVAEAEKMGYFNVENVLAHKFKFGSWRFLVKWEGFPVSASSWEGLKSFKLPNGRLNSVLAKYLKENGLEEVLEKSSR